MKTCLEDPSDVSRKRAADVVSETELPPYNAINHVWKRDGKSKLAGVTVEPAAQQDEKEHDIEETQGKPHEGQNAPASRA